MRVLIRTAADITDRERQACFALWNPTFPQPPGQVRPPDFAEPSTIALLIDADSPTGDTAAGNVLVRDEVATLVAACRLRRRTIAVAGQPHASIIDDQIEAAKFLRGRLHRVLNLVEVGHIASAHMHLRAAAGQLAGQKLRIASGQVGNDDRGAVV